MRQIIASVISNTEVAPGVNLVWIEAPDMATAAQPGQFITVRCEDFLLRRPFSIHQVVIGGNVIASEAKQSQIALLFKVVGKGTLWLAQRQVGDKIDILGPLGKGFSVEPSAKNLLLMAGGVGIAPLVFLAQHAVASSQHQVTLIHGASTAAELYSFSPWGGNISPLPREVRFIPITEDGSVGKKGVVTDILPDFLDWADQIYACGPIDMYKAMSTMSQQAAPSSLRAERSNLKIKKCQVSLEVRMGCGIGACYGCTINTKEGLKQVCHDGPIFELNDILWEEVRI
jgi:dihydroorotate dehydrogenase electron transfer subunit